MHQRRVTMSQSKDARAQALLVQAFKLRQLSARILREAVAIEAAAAPVLASWDDPAIEQDDVCDGKTIETLDSAVTPKERDELLDLIEGDKSAISDGEGMPSTKQNKGNNPFPKSKDKWSSQRESLRQRVSRG